MCIIYLKDNGVDIGYDRFVTSVNNNPDGFGLCFPDYNGKLITARSHIKPDPDKLYKLIHEEYSDKDIMLHLRYTTVGKTTLRNAHPFPILEYKEDGVDVRMAHNGTLNSKYRPGHNSDESDTRVFVRNYVRPLFKRLSRGMHSSDILKDQFVEEMLADQIPDRSVLCFIDGYGNSLIVNPKGNGGDFEEGLWYSNTYSFDSKHREPAKPKPPKTNITPISTGFPSSSCNVQLVSKELGVSSKDLLTMSDETIDEVCKDKDLAARLIKELIHFGWCQAKENDTLKVKLKGLTQ